MFWCVGVVNDFGVDVVGWKLGDVVGDVVVGCWVIYFDVDSGDDVY